jgi:hypothetical protein
VKQAWVLSATAHGLLLLGTALVYTGWIVVAGPPDYECSFKPVERRIDPLRALPERRTLGTASPDPVTIDEDRLPDEVWDRPLPNPGWYIRVGEPWCGTCVNQIMELYQGRAIWLPPMKGAPPCQKPGAYGARLTSVANNRFDQPRLSRR